MSLTNRRVLLGVCGGIAAYKACEVVRGLTRRGAQVQVLMTENATRFVSPLTFETLSGRVVRTHEFDPANFSTGHIELARWGELMVVAPATANTIAQFAHGLAGSLLGTVHLAFDRPVLLAPAMNTVMYEHPATRDNLSLLRSRGVRMIPPRVSDLACGEFGTGAMAEPGDVVEAVERALQARRELEGVRVLVTSGATREHLDPVRFLSNPSSGRMGEAIAGEARDRGARVVLVHGTTTGACPAGIETVAVTGVEEMYEAVLGRAGDADLIFCAAAPGDFVPEVRSEHKIKKGVEEVLTVRFRRAPDILAELGRRRRPGQRLVGFSAETRDLLENSGEKLRRKNVDLIVANEVGPTDRGFCSTRNKITLLYRDGKLEDLPEASKRELARTLLDRVGTLEASGGSVPEGDP